MTDLDKPDLVLALAQNFNNTIDPVTGKVLTDSAWSFPSGHATFFFAMATAIYLYNKKWGIWFFVGAILISIGRVIAGLHYPSDILGGAIIGAFVAYVTFYVAQKLYPKAILVA